MLRKTIRYLTTVLYGKDIDWHMTCSDGVRMSVFHCARSEIVPPSRVEDASAL